MKKLLLSLAAISVTLVSVAQTVTNLNNAGPGSLRNVVLNSQPGDIINFDPALFSNGNAVLSLDYAIPIVHSLTINGYLANGDTLIINGQDSTQAFYMDGTSISAPLRLVLSNMVIERCKTYTNNAQTYNTNGGAIVAVNSDRLELSDVHFRSNRVTGDANGGAIYAIYVDTLSINQCSFISNHSDTTTLSQSGGHGGAVYCRLGHLEISNSIFTGNYSADRGGAIASSFVTQLRMDKVHFENNQAGLDLNAMRFKRGGAMFASGSRDYEISECTFVNNRALDDGGAIVVESYSFSDFDTLDVSNCSFISNEAGEYGGAIQMNRHILVLSNTTFDQNSSDDRGGAVYLGASPAQMSTSTFNHNTSIAGSTIYSAGSELKLFASTLVAGVSNTEMIYRLNFGSDSIQLSNCILDGTNGNGLFFGASYFRSKGYNIFSSAVPFALSTDQTNVSTAVIDLGPLQMNGGMTPTMLPGASSVAMEAGNPNDFSPAQNGPIFGRRDIGAAEGQIIRYDTTLLCGSVTWWGNTYTSVGTYSDTAYNANSIDSVGVLVLKAQDTSVANHNAILVSLEQSPGTSYQWVNCDSSFTPVIGATDSTFQPSVNGNYAVVLTNGNCSDTSACILYDEVSLQESTEEDILIEFFPNPTSGSITIKSAKHLPSQVTVLDLSGREVVSLPISSNEVHLPSLSKGLYLLRWEFENGEVQVDRVVMR